MVGSIGQIAIGLGLLVFGADGLVRGASRLAARVGVSPLVIGLTIVAFGTSAPELAVSVTSSLEGQSDLALGNVVGSNIFNILVILGLAAVIAPLRVAADLVRIDVPLMIGLAFLGLLLGYDGRIGRLDGALLFACLVAFLAYLFILRRRDGPGAGEADGEGRSSSLAADGAWCVGGLVLLVLGSDWLVDGATSIARAIGVTELVIGLTIVAAGTSLPELATSVVASFRGERDIAVGNVVGSNFFNIAAVLGLAALVSPDGVEVSSDALRFDVPVMIAASVACLPVFFIGHVISRWEGAVFLASYVAYAVVLGMNTTGHALIEPLEEALLFFVGPLVLLTLGIYWARIKERGQ